MPASNDNSTPDILADRYRLETPVGQGAHATTWRGWDEKLGRPVAVKILREEVARDPQFVRRFRDEARAAASVRQGNVVDIYDFGQEQGVLYIVMQFVDGQTLKSLIQQRAPMEPREARRIIGNVLDGLQAIHAAGIVHRDIKPQNVLIGRDGVAKVTDFGVAEGTQSPGVTTDGMTIGTVEYMAPEQAQGASLTPAADLYATGVMLYEMLTGTLPFAGTSREIMLQHVNASATPPSVRMPQRGITPAIDAVVMQSLAKDPKRRFANARAMKQALGQALSGAVPSPSKSAQQGVPPARPMTMLPPPVDATEVGAGLNGAMKGIIAIILLGMLGVALWGAVQLLDNQGINLSLPSLDRSSTEMVQTPTATTEPVDDSGGGGIEPIDPEQSQPTETPTEVIQPTEEPTSEQVPIEPIEPTESTQAPDG